MLDRKKESSTLHRCSFDFIPQEVDIHGFYQRYILERENIQCEKHVCPRLPAAFPR